MNDKEFKELAQGLSYKLNDISKDYAINLFELEITDKETIADIIASAYVKAFSEFIIGTVAPKSYRDALTHFSEHLAVYLKLEEIKQ